ncbi:MAG: DinB family protein [Chitinophagaceae bacterium]|nr:DinB family protein [Chitinophagaceae bacterium]
METIFTVAKEQYGFVRDAREALLHYCKTISSNDLLKENSSFGRGGSIRNLLVHIANTYEFWIGKWALGKNVVFTNYDSKQNIGGIIDLFDSIDVLMVEFIESLRRPEIKGINYEINGIKNTTEPFKLFSHVITHEFHHKGQILSLSRHLGYTPIDTDIMR